MLAHGPLGRVENSMSLNITVGHSDFWSLGMGHEGSGVQEWYPGESQCLPSPPLYEKPMNVKVRRDIAAI